MLHKHRESILKLWVYAAFNPQKNVFYVSSVRTGTIGTVDQNGNYKVFYQDQSLKSSYGMKLDVKNNRLWVCISDANFSDHSGPSTFRKMARVISLDLNTGKKMQDIDLSNLVSGEHLQMIWLLIRRGIFMLPIVILP